MQFLYIGLGVAAFLAAAVLLISYACFRKAFYVKDSDKIPKEEYPIPEGKIYEPYRDKMVGWMKEVQTIPCQEFNIRSFDGLNLRGKYYEYAPGAIIEIMFHGYRGCAERDLCGGVQRCFKLGHSALIVDQRCAGKSGGNVITFGINESRDCLDWMHFAIDHFGPDCRLMLTGISMGASTVMIAAGEDLPKNVIGVLADCGFTSAKAIIRKEIRQAMGKCKVPVIFFHGEADDYVPCHMSRENFAACVSKKKLVTVPGAGHGLSIMLDPEGYRAAMKEFFGE